MKQLSVLFRVIKHIFRVFLAVIALFFIFLLALPIGFYGMSLFIVPSLPSLDEINMAQTQMPLQVYTADNQLIGQYGNRMSLPIDYKEVPQQMINAFLAAEDASFFEHGGISIKGLGRAVTQVVTDDNDQTGGSTITMQVAKNYFLSPERTFNRKLTELFLARKIEQNFNKEQIFTLYINKIYLGEGAYGIKAAAKTYYSRSLDHLSLAQMAMIAGLPKAPSKYNPVANPQRALERRNWILGRMLELGFISPQQHQQAVNESVNLSLYKTKLDTNFPALAEMTRYSLVQQFGKKVVNSGWRVKLTLDSKRQKMAEAVLIRGLMSYDKRHGWRGAEAHGEPLENFRRYNNLWPAQVTKVNGRSFSALLQDGRQITVYWSGMGWAKKYYSANRIGGYPSSARSLVKVGDIVRVVPNADQTGWQLSQIPKVQGALVALRPDDGAVDALVGGFNFYHSKFNRATQGWRQPGSTIKPLIYTAALENGFRPDSLVSDAPLTIGEWKPRNSDGTYRGQLTVRQGLYLSRNLVSIRLLRSVGTAKARLLLDQFGLQKDKLPTTLSLALGTGQVLPLQMATAYATFANGGHRIQPYFIDQIFSYEEKLLYQATPERACAICYNRELEKQLQNTATHANQTAQNNPVTTHTPTQLSSIDDNKDLSVNASSAHDRLTNKPIARLAAAQAPRIISANVAYDMANMLRDVIQLGTGKAALKIGRKDIGGKTGTTNAAKDAWFAGFQPTLVAVTWVGFDIPSTLGRREYGGVAALPIWSNFMANALKNEPQRWVAASNTSNAEKHELQLIEVTNDTLDDESYATQHTNLPPQAYVVARPKPAQPTTDSIELLLQNENNTLLEAKSVTNLPPMPANLTANPTQTEKKSSPPTTNNPIATPSTTPTDKPNDQLLLENQP